MPAHIRPFVADDIPAVVAMRRKAFAHSERPSNTELGDYFERIFLSGPLCDDALPSLVHVGALGQPTGFIGVIAGRACFRREPIRSAVSTQLMIDPDEYGLVGVQLLKAFLRGPQVMSLADLSNDTSRALWESLGGSTSLIRSFSWSVSLAGARTRGDSLARDLGMPRAARLLRPLFAAIDGRGSPPGGYGTLRSEPLTAHTGAEHFRAIAKSAVLRPEYDERSLEWLLGEFAARRPEGIVHSTLLRDAHEAVVGWHIYHVANSTQAGQVFQLVARRGHHHDVFAHLVRHAWDRQLVSLGGRVEPAWLPALGRVGAELRRDGPWTLVASPRRDILNAMTRGEGVMSRLDGEGWLSF
jgi:hypothetical protein